MRQGTRDRALQTGVQPKKAFGQHFLADTRVASTIVTLAQLKEDAAVIEIGAGTGKLTRELLLRGHQVTAIEPDADCAPSLDALCTEFGSQFRWYQADARRVDVSSLTLNPSALVGNLPYHVATHLLRQWLPIANSFASMTLMFQEEVAQRIVASVGESGYSRLSVLSQTAAEVSLCLDLGPEAFFPPPKVRSALVRFVPRAQCTPEMLAWVARVTQVGFASRRKQLGSKLQQLGIALESLGMDPHARAETVSLQQWQMLGQMLGQMRGKT